MSMFRSMAPEPPQQHFALEIRSLVKRFDRPAVDGLDLAVHRGEFYALLGPNGAGKTTTLRMVAGLIRPDAGSIHVAGIDALADPVAAKRVTAWVSDEPMIYDKLRTSATTSESLCAWAPCGDVTRGGGIPGVAIRQ